MPVLPDARPSFGWHGAAGVSTLPLGVALMEMGARTYVPALGRFLEADPVVNGGANPYAYANGDPVNGHDTTGTTDKWWAPLVGALVAVVVGVVIGVATAGVGTLAAAGWGIAAAVVGGALGEVTTELINTGTVDLKTVGYAAAIDATLAAITFGVSRYVKGRQLARAAAGRAGPIGAEASSTRSLSTTSSFLNSEQELAMDDVRSFLNGLSPRADSIVVDAFKEPGWSYIEVQLKRAPSVLDLAEDPLNRMSVLSQQRNLDNMKWW